MKVNSCIFTHWAPAVMEFCEAGVYCFPKYPADTFTNLGPLLAGILILIQSRRVLPYLWLGWSAVLTAIFSAFYHGSGTLVAEYLDLFGMHLFLAGCFAISFVKRSSAFNTAVFVNTALLLSAALTGLSLVNINLAVPVFAFVCLGILVWEVRAIKSAAAQQYLIRAVTTLTIAYAFWLLDYLHILCNPENHFLTGHGIWHLLCGYVFYCVFKYYELTMPAVADRR